MTVFSKEQFLIIRSEDFFSDTQSIFNEVQVFLGLPEQCLQKNEKYYVGKYTQQMSAEARKDLADYFCPHNQRLYDYLDRDFAWES